jgi:hypothetical protein
VIFLVKVKLVIEPSSKRAVQWFNKSFELLEPLPEKAKIASFTFSKSIRRSNKQFIAVTCHYDVEDWLEPDWVLCTDTTSIQQCIDDIMREHQRDEIVCLP